MTLVKAAEQRIGPGMGAAKNEAVRADLASAGVEITPQIEAQIEAAVYDLPHTAAEITEEDKIIPGVVTHSTSYFPPETLSGNTAEAPKEAAASAVNSIASPAYAAAAEAPEEAPAAPRKLAEWKCIDISKHNGAVDFQAVKASGVDCVIIRAGISLTADPLFETYYVTAKKAGLHVGAYYYGYAATADAAHAEAKHFLSLLAGKAFDLPVYYDQEYEPAIKALTRELRTEIIRAFCSTVEAAGYFTGLYASVDWILNWINYGGIKQYTIWAAQHGPKCKLGKPYGIWQHHGNTYFDSAGRVTWPAGECPGVTTEVDCNTVYTPFWEIIRSKGLNGYMAGTE
jgi:GH25 family lysozyme M1 (1,4-beta-N-acetylmuramidase)